MFGSGVKLKIKKQLLYKYNLHTIVRLPNGVFSPYTNIKTNILFFDNLSTTREVWYFEHPLPLNQNNYSRLRPIQLSEFDLEKGWWNNREENQYAWKVSKKELENHNYNFDIDNPKKGLDDNRSIEELLLDYESSKREFSRIVEEVRNELLKHIEVFVDGNN